MECSPLAGKLMVLKKYKVDKTSYTFEWEECSVFVSFSPCLGALQTVILWLDWLKAIFSKIRYLPSLISLSE